MEILNSSSGRVLCNTVILVATMIYACPSAFQWWKSMLQCCLLIGHNLLMLITHKIKTILQFCFALPFPRGAQIWHSKNVFPTMNTVGGESGQTTRHNGPGQMTYKTKNAALPLNPYRKPKLFLNTTSNLGMRNSERTRITPRKLHKRSKAP